MQTETTVRGGKEVITMLDNLRAEMTRHGITASDIARVVGKTDRSIRDKISEKRDFTLPESAAIRDELFPGLSLEYLFARGGTVGHEKGA